MSKEAAAGVSAKNSSSGIAPYVIGYVTSIWLSVMAYIIVRTHAFAKWTTVSLIIGLAMLQFLAQLFFFLHLGREPKPRWKLLVLVFMILVVTILVAGSLWIMNNLNYRMTPEQMQTYMNNQSGF